MPTFIITANIYYMFPMCQPLYYIFISLGQILEVKLLRYVLCIFKVFDAHCQDASPGNLLYIHFWEGKHWQLLYED